MVPKVVLASFLVSLCFLPAEVALGQALSVLQIKVVIVDAEQKATPVSRHALLISDNPPTAPPRRIVTAADGTANVRLRPGNYTVESDQPIAFQGRVYQWTERVDVVAGRDTVLELTADNADVEPVGSGTAASSLETDPSFLLSQWHASVVAIWTPLTRVSGFIVDTNGLIATNQRAIGTATEVEAQLTPDVKVSARVVMADSMRDVAILWIDPKAAAAMKPLPIECAQTAKPSVAEGQALFTIGAPLRGQKGLTYGTVTRVEPRSLVSDLRLTAGSAGGPVFASGGSVVGISSLSTEADDIRRARVVRIDAACDVLASALQKIKDMPPPGGTHLPMEPRRPFPVNTLKEMAQGRAGSLSPPLIASTDFDVAFITPVLIYGAQNLGRQPGGRDRGRGPVLTNTGSDILRPVREFSNWSEYVADFPPVLLVRVTPKLVEGFWTTVARGAAMTQGVSLPPIKRVRAGFSRMRAFCGDAEVLPIHPFKLEQRIGETDAIHEGFYVYDPGALGPHCGTVNLVLYSDKEPDKGETRVLDPQVLDRVWQDFAPYRALAAEK